MFRLSRTRQDGTVRSFLQTCPSFMLNNLTHKTYIFSDLVKDPAIMTEVVRAMGPRIWRWIILNPYDDELLIPISDKALVHIVFVRNTITTHQKFFYEIWVQRLCTLVLINSTWMFLYLFQIQPETFCAIVNNIPGVGMWWQIRSNCVYRTED